MRECENCGLLHDKPFIVSRDGKEHTFDSLECAINYIAPRCFHCDKVILGREVQHEGEIYCSLICSRETHFPPVLP